MATLTITQKASFRATFILCNGGTPSRVWMETEAVYKTGRSWSAYSAMQFYEPGQPEYYERIYVASENYLTFTYSIQADEPLKKEYITTRLFNGQPFVTLVLEDVPKSTINGTVKWDADEEELSAVVPISYGLSSRNLDTAASPSRWKYWLKADMPACIGDIPDNAGDGDIDEGFIQLGWPVGREPPSPTPPGGEPAVPGPGGCVRPASCAVSLSQ